MRGVLNVFGSTCIGSNPVVGTVIGFITGGVAEWLRRSVSNHATSTRVGLNPLVGIINHKPTANSGAHPSEAGERVDSQLMCPSFRCW